MNEFKRKAVHLLALAIPIGVWFVPRNRALFILALLGGIWVLGDVLRFVLPAWKNKVERLFDAIIRDREKEKPPAGSSYLWLSAFLSVLLFPKPVAVLSLSFLILGDTAAALAGSRWGRTTFFSGKSLEGSLACWAVCLAAGTLLPLVPWWTTLIGATAAALTELAPLRVDDNLTIPLVSGGLMTLFQQSF
jgi:dolichol kinase